MKARGDIRIWLNRLLDARDTASAMVAQKEMADAAQEIVREVDTGKVPEAARSALCEGALPRELSDFPLSSWPDEALTHLNNMLPWAAVSLDEQGRSLGLPWSAKKRSQTQLLDEPRHKAFNEVYPLAGKQVLEVGCFEGLHTISCASYGAHVTAVDSRMENLVKTLVRLWAYGVQADVKLWDLEQDSPANIPAQWDMLHHIGVLYHLTDPVGHLKAVLPRTREALLLDTHVAMDDAHASMSYEVDGVSYPYFHFRESSVSPFAGVLDHAKWLRIEDLMQLVRDQGFADVRLVYDQVQGNGRRVRIWGFREQR